MDYEPLSEIVTFPPSSGFATQCQDVILLDDDLEEEDETFLVQISDSVCQIAQPEATVTIVDDGKALYYLYSTIIHYQLSFSLMQKNIIVFSGQMFLCFRLHAAQIPYDV